LYHLVKYKLWGSERYLEKASIPIFPDPGYQLHGLMRIKSEVRKMLEPQLPVLPDSERMATAGGAVAIAEARPRFSFDFLFINPLLILLLATVIALIAHPRTRRGTLIGIVGLVLIAPLLLWPYLQKVKRDFAGMPHIERMRQFAQSEGQSKTAASTINTTNVPESTKPAEIAAAKPSWIDQPARLEGSVYRAPVKSGLFVIDQECDTALRAKVQATVNQYIDELLGEGASRKLGDETTRQYVTETYRETVTSPSVGPMRQAYALVEFNEQRRTKLQQVWEAILASERLNRVALITTSVLGLLIIAFTYLKLDLRTAGQFRGRLRFAAVGAIIVLATSIAAVCRAFEL
jgi:hypothetical protein